VAWGDMPEKVRPKERLSCSTRCSKKRRGAIAPKVPLSLRVEGGRPEGRQITGREREEPQARLKRLRRSRWGMRTQRKALHPSGGGSPTTRILRETSPSLGGKGSPSNGKPPSYGGLGQTCRNTRDNGGGGGGGGGEEGGGGGGGAGGKNHQPD